MSDTTYEEVRRCPRCAMPGKPAPGGQLKGGERGSTSITFTCENPRCRWCNSGWVVQVRADGTFPPAVTERDKQFPKLPNNPRIAEGLETLQHLTTQPGAEIRR